MNTHYCKHCHNHRAASLFPKHRDDWTPCIPCQRGRDTTPSGDVGAPKAADVKAVRVMKTARNHDRDVK